ncbi:response regulator transcription factor [Eisenbergiella porci]|uniref:response regulator transcription factor n=1 Tax=Eisenbergiella porci TaxID=2652274 RepID=UPI002A809CF7|nr:response regulator [Eisenbergiella porci]
MRAIVIDDEPAHVRGIIRHVDWERFGFEKPQGFTDAVEALDFLKETAVDVVVTDIKMPEIDGLELIRRINKEGMNTDIIIVSGYDDFPYAQEAIRLGVCAYLLKPLKTEELEECLETIRDKQLEKSMNSIKKNSSDNDDNKKRVYHPSIKKVMQYVNDNYSKDLTIRGLAATFNMNADYLSALFKKETEINLNGYINATRLHAAHKLLEETDCRINEVAYQVGFSTPGYFAEQFRAFYGYTPSEVRKKI